MSERQKNISILSYFAKQRRKESTEIKEHEQQTDSSRPTCNTSASHLTEFDFAEEYINFVRPNTTTDDIAKILPPSRSNNVDKLHLLKMLFVFVPLEKQQWHSIFKNIALLKDNDFVTSTKVISEHIHGWYIQKVVKAFIANTVLYFLCL